MVPRSYGVLPLLWHRAKAVASAAIIFTQIIIHTFGGAIACVLRLGGQQLQGHVPLLLQGTDQWVFLRLSM